MTRLFHLILALAIGVSTAYCGCGVAAASPRPAGHATANPTDENVPACCRHHRQDQTDHRTPPADGHTCPHCACKSAADSSTAKVTVAAPAAVPNLFLSFFASSRISPTTQTRFARGGLPPPVPPQTLFDLACRLTT